MSRTYSDKSYQEVLQALSYGALTLKQLKDKVSVKQTRIRKLVLMAEAKGDVVHDGYTTRKGKQGLQAKLWRRANGAGLPG